MHFRGLIVFVLALAAGAPAAHADTPASVRVLSCSPWHQGEGGSVTYEARMRAVPGTARMALRVRLLERVGDGDYHRVDAEKLDVWRRSRADASAFVWDQHVNGLRQGADYRAAVHFRWLDADGDEIAESRERSEPCEQPAALPNLRVAEIDIRTGEVKDTAVYRVKIANRGDSPARHVGVLLRVDGEVVDEVEVIEVLQPDASRTVTFSGPVCRERLKVVVDPKELIPETDEQDNTRPSGCL